MTREELEAQANRIITGAKHSLESQGGFEFTSMVHDVRGWQVAKLPKWAMDGMNSGEFKDFLFGTIRDWVRRHKCDGVIMASDMWVTAMTEEGSKHPIEEWKSKVDRGFVTLVKMGWATRREAIGVTAQSPTEVLLITQFYQRLPSVQLGEATRHWSTQDTFQGRQKMFGDLREENLS